MEPIIAAIITGIVISIISGIFFALIKRKWQKNDDKKEQEAIEANELREIKKSIWRLNKTVLIMAKIQDDLTAKKHPDLTSSLEDIASELLESE